MLASSQEEGLFKAKAWALGPQWALSVGTGAWALGPRVGEFIDCCAEERGGDEEEKGSFYNQWTTEARQIQLSSNALSGNTASGHSRPSQTAGEVFHLLPFR